MATGDMVARLLLDSKEFDRNLDKSKGKVGKFGKEVNTSTGGAKDGFTGLIANVKNFAAALGAVEVANKAFDAWVSSSQTNTDKWGRVVQSAQTVWENFTHSLFSGDWSAWEGGISSMIEKAEELYNAFDKLNNVNMSVGFVTNMSQYDARQKMLKARNKDLPVEVRREALAQSQEDTQKILDAATAQKNAALDYIKKLIASKSGLSADVIWESSIVKAFEIDASRLSEKEREKMNAAKSYYDEQRKGWKALYDAEIDKWTRAVRSRAGLPDFPANWTVDEAQAASVVKSPEELNALNAIKSRYAEATASLDVSAQQYLVPYIALETLTDEQLKGLMSTYLGQVQTMRGALELQQTQQELGIALNNEESASIAAKTKKAEEYAELIKSMPWNSAAVRTMALNVVPGNLTPENIAKMGGAPGLNSGFNSSVPALPEYGGKYDFWKFSENPIQRTGGLEAMTALPFDAEALKQLVADDELKAWAAKNREEFDKWGSSLNLLSGAFSSLGASIGGASGELFTFVGGLIDAAQQMLPFIAQIMAETAARNANATAATTEAAAKSMSAYAGIPIAGIGLGLAAVAAIVGAVQSVPKFADGGIVTSATLGVFGEAGPEAVMPLDRLEEFVTSRDVRVTGNIKASGKELVVVLDNYNRVRNG